MRRPTVRDLPEPLLAAARAVAEPLRAAGHRGWIVGGAVRDLARGSDVHDVDMASAATPDEVEALFPRTVAVGRAFGTVLVLVRLPGVASAREIQLTTFRSERGYADRRRPDAVEWGRSVEEDARRRDFTCNALFLDPLTDEVGDPEGGLADLAAGRLRCVGDARERFAEDGLRLLRLARFAATCGLEVEGATRAAAAASAPSLAGVSPERVRQELERLVGARAAAPALALLDELGLAGPALAPTGAPREWDAARAVRRLAALEAAGPVSLTLGLAALFDPGPDAGAPEVADAARAVEALRPTRAELRGAEEIWRGSAELARLLELGERASRAERVRLVRAESWPAPERLVRARGGPVRASGSGERADRRLDELVAFASSLSRDELYPAPLLAADDLRRAGVEPGPRFGALLFEAETAQLEGRFRTRRDALAWLDERAPQDGGNARRNA